MKAEARTRVLGHRPRTPQRARGRPHSLRSGRGRRLGFSPVRPVQSSWSPDCDEMHFQLLCHGRHGKPRGPTRRRAATVSAELVVGTGWPGYP